MSSVAISESVIAVSAATAVGELTVSSNVGLYPGSYGWLVKDDGSARARVQIVRLVGSTKLMVKGAPDGTEAKVPAPGYGMLNVSAYNGSSTLFIETQTVPVSWAHSPRNIG